MKSTHKLQSKLQFHILFETTIAEAWQVIEPVGRANPVSTLTLQACNLFSLPPSAASIWVWVGIMQSNSCYHFRNTYDSPSVHSHFCHILLHQGFDITQVGLWWIWGKGAKKVMGAAVLPGAWQTIRSPQTDGPLNACPLQALGISLTQWKPWPQATPTARKPAVEKSDASFPRSEDSGRFQWQRLGMYDLEDLEGPNSPCPLQAEKSRTERWSRVLKHLWDQAWCHTGCRERQRFGVPCCMGLLKHY